MLHLVPDQTASINLLTGVNLINRYKFIDCNPIKSRDKIEVHVAGEMEGWRNFGRS
jgi:hypothetical protein